MRMYSSDEVSHTKTAKIKLFSNVVLLCLTLFCIYQGWLKTKRSSKRSDIISNCRSHENKLGFWLILLFFVLFPFSFDCQSYGHTERVIEKLFGVFPCLFVNKVVSAILNKYH